MTEKIAPTNLAAAKYTDGNSYVLTPDKHFIIRIKPGLGAHEVVYEEKTGDETLLQPVYWNNALFLRPRSTKPASAASDGWI